MRLLTLLIPLFLSLAAVPAQAQFSPVIQVGDKAVTAFELDQRRRLLELFRTPGDLAQVAREQLIDDRLKQTALDRAGLNLSDEALTAELEAFAGRANLDYAQFVTLLAQNGVEESTLIAFVKIGASWRDYIRARFGPQAQISPAEIDRALANASGGGAEGIEILVSEIIIPAPPPEAARANAIANRIAQTRSFAAFEAAAREFSALPSRDNGGRLGWLPLSNYPPQLHPLFLGLSRGEVTAPLQIPNGVALFQMRDIREVPSPRPSPTRIDYAAFYLPGGRTEPGIRAAQQLRARVDTCDDLYGAARGLPAEVLEREALPPAQIPQDMALELARLDPGEVSYNLTRADGQTLVFLMLCDRQVADPGAVDRDSVERQLRSQRLAGYADALLAELRATTPIR